MTERIIIDDSSRYIKAGNAIKRHSDTVKINKGVFYSIKFARIYWAVFKTKTFDDTLKSYYKNGSTRKALYSIMKNHQSFGNFIPCTVKHGKNKGNMFLLSTYIGNRHCRHYYIFDVDENGVIADKAPVYFDISSDQSYKKSKWNI